MMKAEIFRYEVGEDGLLVGRPGAVNLEPSYREGHLWATVVTGRLPDGSFYGIKLSFKNTEEQNKYTAKIK
jgi:hypothetical protein